MVGIIVNHIVKSSKNVFNVLPNMYSTNATGKSNEYRVPMKIPLLLGIDLKRYKKSQEGGKLHPVEHFFKDIRNPWPEVPKITGQLPTLLQNPHVPTTLSKKHIDEPWRRPYPKHYPPW